MLSDLRGVRVALLPAALAALVLLTAGAAEAAVNAFWRELGGSASGNGVSQAPATRYANPPSVAVGPDGRPVVAYPEQVFTSEEEGAILVKRWTGAAWQLLSPAAGIGTPGYSPQVRISPTGTIYVAWLVHDVGGNQVHLRRRLPAGTIWESLSGSDSPGGLTAIGSGVGEFSLAIADDGSPLVAFVALAQTRVVQPAAGILQGSPQVFVKRYAGAAGGWQYLGSDPIDGPGASNARSFPLAGGGGYAEHMARELALAVDSAGRPTVAFSYLTSGDAPVNEEIYVTRWNGSAWTAVGPAVPQSDDGGAGRGGPGGVSATAALSTQPSLAADPASDRLYLAWLEQLGQVYVRRWNGAGAWEELGGSASGDGIGGRADNRGPAVAVDGDGHAVVAWQRNENTPAALSQVFVLRSNDAGGWEEMGPDSASGDGISGSGPEAFAFAPALAQFVSPTGTPPDSTIIAWTQMRPGLVSQVWLRQFDEGPRFLLSVDVVPDGTGRVLSDPIGIECPQESCSEFYPRGQAVRLTPIAGPDYLFDRWLGACTGGGACTVTMSAPRSVNASFAGAATLTVSRQGSSAALGAVTGPGIACGGDCQEKYRQGTLVTLAVTMPTGTLFDGWGGDCAFRGLNTSCALPMSANRTVAARFRQRVYDLVVAAAVAPGTVGQGGIGRVLGFEGGRQVFNCSPDNLEFCSNNYEHGVRLVLQALPHSGNRFLNWAGGPCAGRTSAICEFTLTGAVTTTARFRGVTQLRVSKDDTGAARGVVSGSGLACGADCVGEAFTGTRITLTQAAGAGNRFLGWVGCDHPLAPTCSVLVPVVPDLFIRAAFRLERRHLRVTTEGQGFAQSVTPGINCGTIGSRTDCDEDYDDGAVVTLLPSAEVNSMFVAWTGCSRLNGSACLVDMTANRTVKQRYVPAVRLTVAAVGNGRGRITAPTTPPLICPNGCLIVQMVPAGPSVVLTPRPEAGSNFTWVNPNECEGRTATCTVRTAVPTFASGIFQLNRHRLTVTRRFNGTVVGTVPTGTVVQCGAAVATCATEQDFGTPVSLQAMASPGNVFVSWTGTSPCSAGARATNASCTFLLQANVTATPNFRPLTLVSIVKAGDGDGRVTGPGFNCGADCAEAIFDSKRVTLVATPSPGSSFTTFGGACVSTTPSCAFVPAGNGQNVSAVFNLRSFTLTVASRNQGVVTTLDAHQDGIACGADCVSRRLFGTPVVLQAAASDGFVFDRWTGDAVCAGKTNRTCEFRVPARNASVIPGYRARTEVTVVKQGNGAGLVTGPGINCGADCTEAMFDARRVSLTAAPAVGSELARFAGACVSSTSPCAFVPAGNNQTVTATFNLRRFAVSVARNLSGSVLSTSALPDAVDCGASGTDCTARPDFGTLVTLEAFPDPLFAFGKWTGTVCNGSTNRTCSFRIGLADVSIAPSYRLATEVRLDKTGNGDGTVVSTPAGITCRPDVTECTADFFDGKPVTLRATPVTGSRFAGFSGACASNASACTFTPVGERQVVEAEFTLLRFALGVARRDQGLVNTILPPTNDILCGAGNDVCAAVLDYGRVRLRATPLVGFAFASWAGVACAGGNANAECEFTLAANTSVTPSYRRRTLVTVSRLGEGAGTVTGAGISCGADCAENVLDGRALTLTATAAAGSRFVEWTGACAATTSTCTFVPTGDAQEVSARFERQPRVVTVTVLGSGAVRGPTGECPGGEACVGGGLFGDTVELTALPQGINRLLSWTGCTSVTGTVCRVLLNANRTVTARFSVSLTVRPILAGTGSVTGPGINCGADCTETYAPGTVVTLTRVLGSLSLFLGWGEACASQGTNPTCTLTLNTDQTVAANFLPI